MEIDRCRFCYLDPFCCWRLAHKQTKYVASFSYETLEMGEVPELLLKRESSSSLFSDILWSRLRTVFQRLYRSNPNAQTKITLEPRVLQICYNFFYISIRQQVSVHCLNITRAISLVHHQIHFFF